MTSHPIVEFGYAVKMARLDLEMSRQKNGRLKKHDSFYNNA